jgi:Flp pilus assembly pilin Flp
MLHRELLNKLRFIARLRDQLGATAVEYAIVLSAIFMAVILGVMLLGQETNSNLESLSFP